MSTQYPFGSDALNIIVEALGLPKDDDQQFAYIDAKIEVTRDSYATVTLHVVPGNNFFTNPKIKTILSNMPTFINPPLILRGGDETGRDR
jgi:hypothetical protein